MQSAAFIACELAFLALAHALGGPPWAALGVLACVGQLGGGVRPEALAPLFPGLAWAAAAQATGNRELYFPFAMHLAAVTAAIPAAARPLACLAAGGVIAATFLAIRWLQAATPRVLVVEALATVAVLLAAVGLRRRFPGFPGQWWIPVAAAVMACACLAL